MKNIALFGLMLALAGFTALTGEQGLAPMRKEAVVIHTKNKDYPFTVEIAETPRQQETGLMRRTQLPPHTGMLFLFTRPHDVRMWMKNTPLPLDMLFISDTGEIIYIKHRAMPESTDIIHAGQTVSAVMEIAGGTAEKLGIRAGDRIEHPYFKEHP